MLMKWKPEVVSWVIQAIILWHSTSNEKWLFENDCILKLQLFFIFPEIHLGNLHLEYIIQQSINLRIQLY